MARWLESRALASLLIGLSVFAVLTGVRQLGLLMALELSAYDSFVRSRPPLGGDPAVTMVWITEHEVQELGHPLEDRLMATALRNLMEHRPRAIGVGGRR